MDEGGGTIAAILPDVYLDWGGFAYGSAPKARARGRFCNKVLGMFDLVWRVPRDKRSHDVDFDDYHQFMGWTGGANPCRPQRPRAADCAIDNSRTDARGRGR